MPLMKRGEQKEKSPLYLGSGDKVYVLWAEGNRQTRDDKKATEKVRWGLNSTYSFEVAVHILAACLQSICEYERQGEMAMLA